MFFLRMSECLRYIQVSVENAFATLQLYVRWSWNGSILLLRPIGIHEVILFGGSKNNSLKEGKSKKDQMRGR